MSREVFEILLADVDARLLQLDGHWSGRSRPDAAPLSLRALSLRPGMPGGRMRRAATAAHQGPSGVGAGMRAARVSMDLPSGDLASSSR